MSDLVQMYSVGQSPSTGAPGDLQNIRCAPRVSLLSTLGFNIHAYNLERNDSMFVQGGFPRVARIKKATVFSKLNTLAKSS